MWSLLQSGQLLLVWPTLSRLYGKLWINDSNPIQHRGGIFWLLFSSTDFHDARLKPSLSSHCKSTSPLGVSFINWRDQSGWIWYYGHCSPEHSACDYFKPSSIRETEGRDWHRCGSQSCVTTDTEQRSCTTSVPIGMCTRRPP